MKGTVKFFSGAKGFGFISGEDGTEYFVHMTGLNQGVRIDENDTVEFDVSVMKDGVIVISNIDFDVSMDGNEISFSQPLTDSINEMRIGLLIFCPL